MAKQDENRRDYTGVELNNQALRHVGHTQIRSSRSGLGPHVHPKCYEICYLRSGEMHWWAGDEGNDFIVRPGEMSITYPDEQHGGVDEIHQAGDLYWLSLEITPETCNLSQEQSDYMHQKLQSAPRHFAAPKHIPAYYELLLSAVHEPGPLASVRIRSALELILLTVIDASHGQVEKRLNPSFERVIAAIEADPAAYKSVDDLAQIAGLSANRFINRFKAYTGYSPMDFVNRERIHIAKRLLSDPTASVTDICFQLDYSSTQYFATTFKKYTGMTPSQFRSESFR